MFQDSCEAGDPPVPVDLQFLTVDDLSKARWLQQTTTDEGVIAPRCWVVMNFKKLNRSCTLPLNVCKKYFEKVQLLSQMYGIGQGPRADGELPLDASDDESDTPDQEEMNAGEEEGGADEKESRDESQVDPEEEEGGKASGENEEEGEAEDEESEEEESKRKRRSSKKQKTKRDSVGGRQKVKTRGNAKRTRIAPNATGPRKRVSRAAPRDYAECESECECDAE